MGLVASKGTNAASGIWTLKDMRDYCATGKWPGSGGSTPPAAPPSGDPLYSQVRALLHLDSMLLNPDSQLLEDFADSSRYAVLFRSAGGAVVTSDPQKYGGGAALFGFNSSTGYIFSTASGSGSTPGIYSISSFDDFTVEAWIYAVSQTTQRFSLVTNCDTSDPAQRGFSLYLQYFIRWGLNSNSTILSAAMPYQAWTHIAVSRSSNTIRLFVDGTVQASTFDTNAYTGDAHTLLLGGGPSIGGFGGWIDDFRLTVGAGAGRYTANFTPPTAPFPDAL